MFKMTLERRFKITYISEKQVLSLFTNFRCFLDNDTICINNYKLPNLPEDVEISSVHYDYQKQAFGFILYSKEWPIIKITQSLEVIDLENGIIAIKGKYIKQQPREFYL